MVTTGDTEVVASRGLPQDSGQGAGQGGPEHSLLDAAWADVGGGRAGSC